MAGLPRLAVPLRTHRIGLHTSGFAKAPFCVSFTRSKSSQVAKYDLPTSKPELDSLNFDQGRLNLDRPPLAPLSTGALIRSTLISTISSHPLLLTPALHTLSFLCKPIGGPLFDVDRNPILRGILRATFYHQFCAGETFQETKACVQRLKDLGFKGIIMTYAKETVYDHRTKTTHFMSSHAAASGSAMEQGVNLDPDIQDWREGVMKTVGSVGHGDYVALKLTGAGHAVTTALAAGKTLPKQMLDAVNDICTECKRRNIGILVDAESQHFQKTIDSITLDLMRRFNRNGTAVVYNTYQAYLKSTVGNVINHLSAASEEGFTLGLKLVRGAYLLSDDRSLIHDTKEDTDSAYNYIAQGALRRQIGEVGSHATGSMPFPSVKLLLCSHNKQSLFAALRLHQHRVEEKLPTVDVTFAQLHGMSDALSLSLLQQNGSGAAPPAVLKCSAWGTLGECLAFLVRRAVENKSAVVRTGDEHQALKEECWRRVKRAFSG